MHRFPLLRKCRPEEDVSPSPSSHRVFRFERLLMGDLWEHDVRVEVCGEGRIASLQPSSRGAGCERVRGWTVPGVPNLHSHSFQRALAGLAEASGPRSFWSWRDVMYRLAQRLTPEDVGAITLQLYVELLKAGFTCVGEFHYLHRPPDGGAYADPAEMSRRIVAAAHTAGIGLVHMPVVYETGGLGGEPLEGGQRRFRLDLDGAGAIRDALAGDGGADRVRLGVALHSVRAVRRGTFARIAEHLRPPGTPAHIHVAEQEREVRDCLAQRGARPVQWLLDHAPVDEGWCLVHATHMTDAESAAVARRGAVAGLCPTTEANLGDGLFPLGAYAAGGGRYGIGTDSHVSRSPVEELRLLDYGQRIAARARSVPRAAPDAERGGALAGAGGVLLAHAWEDGCRALAWDAGTVAAGRRADLVVLDGEHPALTGRSGHAVLDSWVFSGTDSPVRDVMVGGGWVVRDGRHEREDEAARAFARAVRRLGG